VKILAQEDGTGSFVCPKLVSNGDLEFPRRLTVGHGEVENRVRDGTVEPRADAAVHLFPIGISAARRNRAIDVGKKPEHPAHRLGEGRPLAVIGVLQVQRHGDVRLDGDCGVRMEEKGAGRSVRGGRQGGGASR
jgi:hypothetical protein